MRRLEIGVLVVVVAAVAFFLGRATKTSTAMPVVRVTPVATPAVAYRIPAICDDTMRFALATWQQVSDGPFADEIKVYLASPPDSLQRATAREDLAGEAAKLWALIGQHGGHSKTVSRCLALWLHQPDATP